MMKICPADCALPKTSQQRGHVRSFHCAVALPALLLAVGLLQAPGAVPIVTGDRAGLNGTTHAAAFDGKTTSYFRSSFNDWQFIQIDFGASGLFSGVRRHMTSDGTNSAGSRTLQGEGISLSLDGVSWTPLHGTNAQGWEAYVNYGAARTAWHSVSYGWSTWLMPTNAMPARYVRFQWDGNNDALNEVEIRFAADRSLAVDDFGPQADRIGFDNLAAGAVLASQLRMQGLRWRSGDSTALWHIENAISTRVAPRSSPLMAASGGSNNSVEIRFDFPRSKFGMHFARPTSTNQTRATLQAFDASGQLLTQAVTTVTAPSARMLTNFIGVGVSGSVIQRVRVTFDGPAGSTLLDDLMVEPGQAALPAPAESVQPLRHILESATGTRQQKFEAIRSLQLLPSPAASAALQAAARANPDLPVRERAIQALTQLSDPASLPTLAEIGLKPANAAIRRAAYNAVWALRRDFPMSDPPRVTVTALTAPRPGEPYAVEVRVVSPVDRNFVRIKFKSSKQAQVISRDKRTQHYAGPMRAGQELVLRGEYVQERPGRTEIPVTVRVAQSQIDGTTYRVPLYVDAQPGGGTATMNPFPAWRDLTRHLIRMAQDDGRAGATPLVFMASGGGERNTVVEGFLTYQDGDPGDRLAFTPQGAPKPCRVIKVQVVDMADLDEVFGEGHTDDAGHFSIPVEDVPDNATLGLVLEVDNYMTKLYVDTDIGDEDFRALMGGFSAGTAGPIDAGERNIPVNYVQVEVDENGILPGGDEQHSLAFAAAMNINEVILVTREDMDTWRDPHEQGDGIGQVDVEYGDEAWNHYFEDLVLTAGQIDGMWPSNNTSGVDYGWVDSTIAHEYTHHLEYEIGSWDSHFPASSTHSFCDEIDTIWANEPEFAWSEGFADYVGNYIAQTKPGMSTVRTRDVENACGTRGSGVTWSSNVRDDVRWYSVEGHVAGALWDLSDPRGEGDDLWDQVDGDAINGHGIIMQIFDYELGDAGFAWGLFDDAPDLSNFYTAWNTRFSSSDFAAGKPVVDPLFNRLGIVPGGERSGTVRRAPPAPVVEGLPPLPNASQAALIFTQTNAHFCLLPLGVQPQYDPPIPAPFAPGQPVLTIRRHWSYLDANPPGPDTNVDIIQVRFGVSNLGLLTMETDEPGSAIEAVRATYSVSVQYGPGAANWLEVTTTNNVFVQARAPEVHAMAIRFLPSVFELDGGQEYVADIVLEVIPGTMTTTSSAQHRVIRIIFDQLIGPGEDCDHDGLTNREEMTRRRNEPARFGCLEPRFADSDADGLNDFDEINLYFTSPCLWDTDGDGLSDGVEARFSCLNPLVADAHLDADGDGLTNGQELSGAVHTDPCDGDTDKDGILDGVDNCRLYPNPLQSDLDGDGRGDVCDGDIDGDGCANLYDPHPTDVAHPDSACLARPNDPALTKDGRLIQEFDPRLDDPRWQMLLDGIRPNGPDSCGQVSCPPPSATLLDPFGKTVRTVFANELGFDQRSGFATVAQLLPDLDGDGTPEMAIAAPNANAAGVIGAGQVVIVSGKSGRELGRSQAKIPNARFGSALGLVSRTELAIGAPGVGEITGAVHLLRLSDFSTGNIIKGTWLGDRFGAALVTGETDRSAELAIGAPNDRGRGGVYAWNARDGLRRLGMGLMAGDEFGAALAWAGDITHDGWAELLVGAPGATRDGIIKGAFAAAAIEASSLPQVGEVTLLSINGERIWSQLGSQPGERFGSAVASVPTIENAGPSAGSGQGPIRFLIGAPGWQNQQGRAYFVTAEGEMPQVLEGQKVGGQLGMFVTAGPDLDGDGEPSFVIGEGGIAGSRGAPGVSTIVQAFVRPRILSFKRIAAGRFEMHLRGEAGVRYELQSASSLAKWEHVADVMTTGTEDTLIANSTAAVKFYRLVAH